VEQVPGHDEQGALALVAQRYQALQRCEARLAELFLQLGVAREAHAQVQVGGGQDA
jgi:hypothetical protein